jgi:SAM-dependent methyltransferase
MPGSIDAASETGDPFGVLQQFGRDLARLSQGARGRWLKRGFHYWRTRGFPYPHLTPAEQQAEFRRLAQVDARHVLTRRVFRVSTLGLRLANFYHPQIWEIPRHGSSPVDCFHDDDILRAALQKAVRFYPDRRCWNGQCLRSILRFYHRSRVSNFRPTVARALYLRYSREGARILDFAAGFGGRLLGALTLRRSYLGIDPDPRQVRGMRRMIKKLAPLAAGTATIHQGCAETLLPELPARSFDVVFSSPPYYDTEPYDQSPKQSFRRYASYALWRDAFLKVVIRESCRVLEPGGYLMLNLKNLGDYPIATDAERFFPKGYRRKPPLSLLLPALPHLRSGRSCLYTSEPILIVQRPFGS